MDPFTIAMLGGLAVQAGSGLLAYFTGKGDKAKADRLQKAAIEKYGTDSEEAINAVAVELLGPTEMAKIQVDPAYQEAQMKALDSLQDIGDSGGMTLADESTLNKLNNDLGRQEAVERNRISDDMASRGIGGSGTELAMLRASGQDRLQRQSEASMDIAGKAQQRALDAIMGAGEMGGKMRSQEWGEKSQVAQAQDAISRYNNTATNNLSQWKGDARLGVAGNTMQAQTGYANQLRQNAAQNQQTIAGVGQGGGQAIQTFGAYKYGQPPAATGGLAQPGSVQEQKAIGVQPQGTAVAGRGIKASSSYDPYADPRWDDEDEWKVS